MDQDFRWTAEVTYHPIIGSTWGKSLISYTITLSVNPIIPITLWLGSSKNYHSTTTQWSTKYTPLNPLISWEKLQDSSTLAGFINYSKENYKTLKSSYWIKKDNIIHWYTWDQQKQHSIEATLEIVQSRSRKIQEKTHEVKKYSSRYV